MRTKILLFASLKMSSKMKKKKRWKIDAYWDVLLWYCRLIEKAPILNKLTEWRKGRLPARQRCFVRETMFLGFLDQNTLLGFHLDIWRCLKSLFTNFTQTHWDTGRFQKQTKPNCRYDIMCQIYVLAMDPWTCLGLGYYLKGEGATCPRWCPRHAPDDVPDDDNANSADKADTVQTIWTNTFTIGTLSSIIGIRDACSTVDILFHFQPLSSTSFAHYFHPLLSSTSFHPHSTS